MAACQWWHFESIFFCMRTISDWAKHIVTCVKAISFRNSNTQLNWKKNLHFMTGFCWYRSPRFYSNNVIINIFDPVCSLSIYIYDWNRYNFIQNSYRQKYMFQDKQKEIPMFDIFFINLFFISVFILCICCVCIPNRAQNKVSIIWTHFCHRALMDFGKTRSWECCAHLMCESHLNIH